MPYKNLVFVKIQLGVLREYRFTDQLSDDDKLIFFLLIALSGVTHNKIPRKIEWISRFFNLKMSKRRVENSIKNIASVFPKLVIGDEFIYWKNFEKIHNYICEQQVTNIQEKEGVYTKEFLGLPEVYPKETLGLPQNMPKNKNKNKNKKENKKENALDPLRRLVREYAILKKISESDLKANYPRLAKAAKNLLSASGEDVERAVKALHTGADYFNKRNLSWKIETVVKNFPELNAEERDPDENVR